MQPSRNDSASGVLRAGRSVSALALAVVLAPIAMLPIVQELGAAAAVVSVPFRGQRFWF